MNCVWRHYAPYAPHMGGVVESMVRCSKRALFSVLQTYNFSDEELQTALVMGENLINRRPLGMLSDTDDSLLPLTPLHFLAGNRISQPVDLSGCRDKAVAKWEAQLEFQAAVWERFCLEIRPDLEPKGKWWSEVPALKRDDIVVMFDLPAKQRGNGNWPMARVLEVMPGSDGMVRTVRVLMQGTEYVRHVRSLMPLL